jgi:hypothetical protein
VSGAAHANTRQSITFPWQARARLNHPEASPADAFWQSWVAPESLVQFGGSDATSRRGAGEAPKRLKPGKLRHKLHRAAYPRAGYRCVGIALGLGFSGAWSLVAWGFDTFPGGGRPSFYGGREDPTTHNHPSTRPFVHHARCPGVMAHCSESSTRAVRRTGVTRACVRDGCTGS